MGMDDIEGDEPKPDTIKSDEPMSLQPLGLGPGVGRGMRGPMDRNVPLDEGAPGTFDHPSLHQPTKATFDHEWAAPTTELPAIRPAKGTSAVRVTWKDADGNAQSIVMGQGPAEALLPALVCDLLADPPAITELKVRRA